MNKTELIREMARRTGMSKANADFAVNALIEAVMETLIAGEPVSIVGFGTFEPVHQKERSGGGITQTIPARTRVKFRPGKTLALSVRDTMPIKSQEADRETDQE